MGNILFSALVLNQSCQPQIVYLPPRASEQGNVNQVGVRVYISLVPRPRLHIG